MYGIISTARSRLLLFLAASRLQLTAGQCGSSCWMSTDPFDTIPFGDIPVISKEIQLIGNNLLDIDYFRTGFARLATVVLKGHPRITVFPNFDNIAFALQDLTIQYTSMRTIKPHNLQILLNLRYLDMSHNQLVSPIPDMDPSEGTWLRELQLVNNSLNEVPHLAEIGLGLKKLNIGSNEHITHANKHTLALYTNVMFLGIAACKLTTVPDFRILSEKSLASSLEINLEGNEITDLDPGTLAYLNQSNWSLFLAYNPISRIPNMIHVDLQIKVELAENPILCNCEAAWLKVAGSLTAFNLSAITCAGPEAVKGQKISDLITDQLYCQGKIIEQIFILKVFYDTVQISLSSVSCFNRNRDSGIFC